MKMNQIEYFEDTKQLFRKFVKPVTIDDVNKRTEWYSYEDKIKEFLEEQLNIKINIYFTNNYKGRYIWRRLPPRNSRRTYNLPWLLHRHFCPRTVRYHGSKRPSDLRCHRTGR